MCGRPIQAVRARGEGTQKYLRGITRRSCQWRTAAVEAQAECFAQAASDAIDAGTPIVEVMTLIQDRQYGALYQLEARLV